MKANAIVRIVIYALIIVLLTGILLAGLGIGMFTFRIGTATGTVVENEASVSADAVKKLEIDWAAGSIRIETAETDTISFCEITSDNTEYRMTYQLSGDTLKLSYGTTSISIGFISIPSKDLIITVPTGWSCKELEIDGASLSVNINGISIDNLDLDGASNDLEFRGGIKKAEIDGASNSVTLICTDRPGQIDMDGASCELTLTLPKDCGFNVQMDGLSCDFHSDLHYTGSGGDYTFGDRYCTINVDGISCDVTINESED